MFYLVSNAKPLQVTLPTWQNADNGWTVNVLDFDGNILVFNVPFTNLQFSTEVNGIGGGSVTFPLDLEILEDSTVRTNMLDREWLWSLYEDGVLRAQFINNHDATEYVNDNGQRMVMVSGDGPTAILQRAVVLPPTYPNIPANEDAVVWIFGYNNDGVIWHRLKQWYKLFNVAKTRAELYSSVTPPVSSIIPLFGGNTDAGGEPWVDQPSIRQENGVNLYDLLVTHTQAVGADFVMRPGPWLDVRFVLGARLESSVAFFVPVTVQKAIEKDRSEVQNFVVAQDDMGFCSTAINFGSINKWGYREGYQATGSVSDASVRDARAIRQLEIHKEEVAAWTLTVPPYLTAADGVRVNRVFVDYNVGDWIGFVSDGEDGETTVTPLRVMAISGEISDSGYRVELTLNTSQQLQIKKLQDQVDETGQGDTGGGTGRDVQFHEDLHTVTSSSQATFAATFMPHAMSEHVVVGNHGVAGQSTKLKRDVDWTRDNFTVTLTNPTSHFTGSGPWWLSIQYSHENVTPINPVDDVPEVPISDVTVPVWTPVGPGGPGSSVPPGTTYPPWDDPYYDSDTISPDMFQVRTFEFVWEQKVGWTYLEFYEPRIITAFPYDVDNGTYSVSMQPGPTQQMFPIFLGDDRWQLQTRQAGTITSVTDCISGSAVDESGNVTEVYAATPLE